MDVHRNHEKLGQVDGALMKTLLRDQLPIVFPNGGRWTEFTTLCNTCRRPIPEERLYATLSFSWGAYDLLGEGLCPRCQLLTTFQYRFHPDMSLTGNHPSTGEYTHWRPMRPPESLWARFKR
jgi:hypothetical protein